MDILDLSGFFLTKSQATDFSSRLSSITDNLYETNFKLEALLQKYLGVTKKDRFLSLLRNNKVPMDTNTALKNFLDKIQKTISSMPTVTLTLATEPDEDGLKEISDWFPLNLKKQVLVEIQVNPDLVAGAIISYQGKQFNASIKPLFEQTSPSPPDRKPTKANAGLQKTTGNIKNKNV